MLNDHELPEGAVRIGYMRVSTDDQDFDLQRRALLDAGVEEKWIYFDKMTGRSMKRPQLAWLLKAMRSGDELVVWKLDRLGRSALGVLNLIKQIDGEGVKLHSLTENFDTSSAMGRAVMTIMLAVAELESNLIGERTKAGMAAKKAAGKLFGRQRNMTPARMERWRDLRASGGLDAMSAPQVAEELRKIDKGVGLHVQTYRNWVRQGCPGLPVDPEYDQ